MSEYAYAHMPLPELVRMVAYNAKQLAEAPPKVLEAVRDDLLEAAELIMAAAEYVEDNPPTGPGPVFLSA